MADIITFLDKEELDPNTGVDDKYLVRAADINEIKKAVNEINKNVETVLSAMVCILNTNADASTLGSYNEWKANGGK